MEKEVGCLMSGDFKPWRRGQRRGATANTTDGIQLMGGVEGGSDLGENRKHHHRTLGGTWNKPRHTT